MSMERKEYSKNLTHTPQEYFIDRTFRQIGKGDNVKYIVRWYGYIPAVKTIEPPKHVLEHFIIRSRRRFQKHNKVPQGCGRLHTTTSRTFPKCPTIVEYSNVHKAFVILANVLLEESRAHRKYLIPSHDLKIVVLTCQQPTTIHANQQSPYCTVCNYWCKMTLRYSH